MSALVAELSPGATVDPSLGVCKGFEGQQRCLQLLEDLNCASSCNSDSGAYISGTSMRVCSAFAATLFDACTPVWMDTLQLSQLYPDASPLLASFAGNVTKIMGSLVTTFAIDDSSACFNGTGIYPQYTACCDPYSSLPSCPVTSLDPSKYQSVVNRTIDSNSSYPICPFTGNYPSVPALFPPARCPAAANLSCCPACSDLNGALQLASANMSALVAELSPGATVEPSLGVCKGFEGQQRCLQLLEDLNCASTCNPSSIKFSPIYPLPVLTNLASFFSGKKNPFSKLFPPRVFHSAILITPLSHPPPLLPSPTSPPPLSHLPSSPLPPPLLPSSHLPSSPLPPPLLPSPTSPPPLSHLPSSPLPPPLLPSSHLPSSPLPPPLLPLPTSPPPLSHLPFPTSPPPLSHLPSPTSPPPLSPPPPLSSPLLLSFPPPVNNVSISALFPTASSLLASFGGNMTQLMGSSITNLTIDDSHRFLPRLSLSPSFPPPSPPCPAHFLTCPHLFPSFPPRSPLVSTVNNVSISALFPNASSLLTSFGGNITKLMGSSITNLTIDDSNPSACFNGTGVYPTYTACCDPLATPSTCPATALNPSNYPSDLLNRTIDSHPYPPGSAMPRCPAAANLSCCTACQDIDGALKLVSTKLEDVVKRIGPANSVDPSLKLCDLYSDLMCEQSVEDMVCALTCNPDAGRYVTVSDGAVSMAVCPSYASFAYEVCKGTTIGNMTIESSIPDAGMFLSTVVSSVIGVAMGISSFNITVQETSCFNGSPLVPATPACCDPLSLPSSCPLAAAALLLATITVFL
ncbi:unnamed protein product [Closterium sp. Yama58-4]|nr:unnamed protein product [Closterium sp. Yama58-4]